MKTVLAYAYFAVILTACAHAPPPTVVMLPQSASVAPPTTLQKIEAALKADYAIMLPCLKELFAIGIEPSNLVTDARDVAAMMPCIEELHAVHVAVAQAIADGGSVPVSTDGGAP